MLTQNITKHSKKYTPLTQGTNVTKILKLTNKTREENSELEDREVREREERGGREQEVGSGGGSRDTGAPTHALVQHKYPKSLLLISFVDRLLSR